MESTLILCGRRLSAVEIEQIRTAIKVYWKQGRKYISKFLCKQWGWVSANGQLKDMSCRTLLLKLESRGLIQLPERQRQANNQSRYHRNYTVKIDTSPIECLLSQLLPIELRMVRWSEKEKDYAGLVSQYHYLGYQPMVGANLKYIAYSQGRAIGCLGWMGAAWKVKDRDRWIGWKDEERRQRLYRIAQNNRYLILPWVKVRHLSSYLLGMNARVIAQDWQKVYGYRVVVLETFVDTERFKGTSYRAANWIWVGQTQGRGKYDSNHQNTQSVKAVYVYPLEKRFRERLKNG